VVGIVEVLSHLPRIYTEYRRLLDAALAQRPALALLTDAPDFHLRLARRLHRARIPVVYLVAPQAWAWRRRRVHLMRRVLTHLLCIFPFEEPFFRGYGVPATYIGHPLAGRVAPRLTREEFFRKHRLAPDRPLVVVLPGSRHGEAARHLPPLLQAMRQLNTGRATSFVLAASTTTGREFFLQRVAGPEVQLVEGETWDALAHADLALVASGTATVEAALLGTPMVTFYRVHPASWLLGRWLVRAPYLSMVNLLAGRRLVPELIQGDCTGPRIAAEAQALLNDAARQAQMRAGLAELKQKLDAGCGAMERAAAVVETVLRSL
jgi:lipid-A-disaccharide synthase